MNNTNYPLLQEEFGISNEEKKALKQRVCIAYSIEKADTRNISEFEVFSHDFELRGGTQYFRFEIILRNHQAMITKRYENFKIFHEEMEAELRNYDKGGMNISPPSYHIMPQLPSSDISKTTENLQKRQEELRLYILKIISYEELESLIPWQRFLTEQNDVQRPFHQRLSDRVFNVIEMVSTTVVGTHFSEEISEYRTLLPNHLKMIKWFEVEYDKFANLNELNQITYMILAGENKTEDQISAQYRNGLMYLRRYITYFEDITKRITSIVDAFLFYEEKKEEYKKIKLADSKVNITTAPEGSKRAKLLVYIRNSSYFLKREAKWMNLTIKGDLVYLNKRIQEIINSLQQLQQ